MIDDDLEASERNSERKQYPLIEEELYAIDIIIEKLRKIIREHAHSISATELCAISVLLRIFERMPEETPEAPCVTVSFLTAKPTEGNRSWVDIRAYEGVLELGEGAHFYDPDVGGDTESQTIFSMVAGTDRIVV